MIAKSISIVRENLWFYLFFAAIVLALTALSYGGVLPGPIGITTIFLWQLFARFVTRSALFGVKFTDRNPDGSNDNVVDSFILKALGLAAVSLVIAELPASCAPSGEATMCEQLTAAPAGSYVLELQAYGSCPECVCDEQGSCDGSPEAPTMLLPVNFDLPTNVVETVIPVCFFGCAGE